MRVIFVGVHNKSNLVPLCSSTKSGKLINRVINNISIECIKTNLFNIDRLPHKEEIYNLCDEWYWTNLPTKDDIIVLLGAIVHREFIFNELTLIKVAHPSSMWSHENMNNYVSNAVDKINSIKL